MRQKSGPLIIVLVIVVTSLSCIEKFEPESKDFESVLVVDGFISNANQAYTVRLSSTAPLGSKGVIPESGALVSVADGNGNSFVFSEVSPGQYESDPALFIGNVGEIYSLCIERSDGREYKSDEIALKRSPPIDSIYYKRDQRLADSTGILLDGIRLMVDSHDPEGKTRFYKYEWIETYEIRVPYPDIQLGYPVQFCYNSDTSKNIIVTSTKTLVEDRVSEFEVNYVNTVSYKLRTMYSILVRQYALEEKTFKYLTELQRTSETLGTLFDPLPYELRGNVRNVVDLDEPVLGYFDAGAPSEFRLFVSAEELADLVYPILGCYQLVDTVHSYEHTPIGWCLASKGPYGTDYNLYAPPECCDCRLYGSLDKPDYFP